jgi:hypothetical protein
LKTKKAYKYPNPPLKVVKHGRLNYEILGRDWRRTTWTQSKTSKPRHQEEEEEDEEEEVSVTDNEELKKDMETSYQCK